MTGSMWLWMALWTCTATFGLLIKSTVWTVAVSGVFQHGRGLALGAVLGGIGVSQVITPPLTEWLIRGFGWRQAYFILAGGWGGLALALAVPFLFDAYDRNRREAAAAPNAAPPQLTGLSFGEALRDRAMYKLAASTLLVMVLTGGVSIHMVAILDQSGFTRPQAALIAGLSGVAGLLGKAVAGWLSDRWNARWVGAFTLAAPAVAFLLLLEEIRTPALVVAAMLILGYVIGVKLQVTAYLTSRYAGMKNFGKIYGIMSSLVTVGSAAGPAIASAVYDHFKDYEPLFLGSAPFFLVSAWLILTLGPYPDWETRAAPAAT
jgi:predicted MFS family arabinose efflux permease